MLTPVRVLFQVFVAVALPSLAYRETSDYHADLEGMKIIEIVRPEFECEIEYEHDFRISNPSCF